MEINEAVGKAMQTRWLVHREGLQHLCRLAQEAPDGMGVEIGAYVGSSLIAWSLVREGRGEAFGVDNWAYAERGTPQQREKCLHNLEVSGAPATMLEMDSVSAAAVTPGPLAFVFIDGDHEYESVRQDIEMWTPKIMSGGIVAFHDYGARRHPGVTKAINEWIHNEHWYPMGEKLTVIGFRKP